MQHSADFLKDEIKELSVCKRRLSESAQTRNDKDPRQWSSMDAGGDRMGLSIQNMKLAEL